MGTNTYSHSHSYYDVLQVTEKATPEQLKSAYRTLAKRYHPDTNHSPETDGNFRRINEAYQVLGDPAKRLQYDHLLARVRIITARPTTPAPAKPYTTHPAPPPARTRPPVHDCFHAYRAYCALLIFLFIILILGRGFINPPPQESRKQPRVVLSQPRMHARQSRQTASLLEKQFQQSGTKQQRPTLDEMLDRAAAYCGEKFSLILTNLRMPFLMPKTDGIALLERIKGSPAAMAAAVHDIPAASAAIGNHAYDSLLEPFESGQLPAMIRRELDSRQAKIENRSYPRNLESLAATPSNPLRPAMRELERSYYVTLKTLADSLGL
jgi:curved DNA-binding protein CbpA